MLRMVSRDSRRALALLHASTQDGGVLRMREGAPAQIVLYSSSQKLQGHVASIGRAIYDQSVETDSGLVPDVKPNIPWVRLAQRIPVRISFDKLPPDLTLVSGTTCTVSVGSAR